MGLGIDVGGVAGSKCRYCSAPLEVTVVDLGMSPPCQSLVTPEQLGEVEHFYPLHVQVCSRCWLVQLPEVVAPEDIFTEYAYFSGYATSWVEHARRYVDMIRQRLSLVPGDLVVELASNDGYLLQHFVGSGIRILGIDPAANVARAAEERGVPTLVDFFGRRTATELVADGRRASLVIGNNVLAQVPDLNDFVAGVAMLLERDGTATFEFPHLVRLFERVEYDTIYHEHYSYFSLGTLVEILAAHGLRVYDVEELSTHGGSLRVYAGLEAGPHAPTATVAALMAREERLGLRTPGPYERFARGVEESKRGLLELLIRLRREGRQIVGYGAPGKGNTLLNYCGIRRDLLEYTVDRNPYKQGNYTPGTRIPIFDPEQIERTRPDYLLVLPWNLIDEIATQLEYVTEWGGRLIVPIPSATIIEPGEGAAERLAEARRAA